ncbi:MAG: YigZ family protein [Acidobacteriota bacterium]|nr:YigZ family protein [Acidobacteriota bacterium]
MGREEDRYLAVERGPEIEIKVKGSRFIGQVLPASDREQAAAGLLQVRRRYHDATHHCWARRVGAPGRDSTRYDDDGEPPGTAGPPILGAIEGAGVYQALVVVTRYFGGTKLGSGGLVRAYGEAAREALAAAPRRAVWLEQALELRCRWEDLGTVEAVLAREGAWLRGVEREFGDCPRLEVRALRSKAGALIAALTEATGGRVRVQAVEE